MKNLFIIILSLLIIGCKDNPEQRGPKVSHRKQVSKYNFNERKIGLKSPKAVADGVIDFLRNADTTQYLSLAIPLKAQQYLLEQSFELGPDIPNRTVYLDSLAISFEERMDIFLVRSYYIHKIMTHDLQFDIQKAHIDSVIIKPETIKNYGGFDRPIHGNWAEVTFIMNYKGEPYYFQIPQIVEIKGKWFLYYPEYYIRDQKEMDFIHNYLKRKKELENNNKEHYQ